MVKDGVSRNQKEGIGTKGKEREKGRIIREAEIEEYISVYVI
jgi:hypothetical protein